MKFPQAAVSSRFEIDPRENLITEHVPLINLILHRASRKKFAFESALNDIQ